MTTMKASRRKGMLFLALVFSFTLSRRTQRFVVAVPL
jgi:hypothetical protein